MQAAGQLYSVQAAKQLYTMTLYSGAIRHMHLSHATEQLFTTKDSMQAAGQLLIASSCQQLCVGASRHMNMQCLHGPKHVVKMVVLIGVSRVMHGVLWYAKVC